MEDLQSFLRIGYDLIINEIPEHARVLDLGCGNGKLLEELQTTRKIDGYGVEISAEGVSMCLEKGLYCYQGDIDDGLADYRDNSFDYVILNQTLQHTKRPRFVLQEIMRICRNTIISFPNFGHYTMRLQLLLKGRMPKNSLLPYDWFNSPNIHLFTIEDFQDYCRIHSYPVKQEMHFSVNSNSISQIRNFRPNFLAEFGFFILDGEKFVSK
ncbi:MAG TPA: methionine biosynthesis protein MetW [Spirochaetota bacterium]|nr:methionine biosynthesis protein MetW [Spirochaetota bacterium]HQO02499.1 methionine biosynthesis protein MetW [Spirochaetota bacterium]